MFCFRNGWFTPGSYMNILKANIYAHRAEGLDILAIRLFKLVFKYKISMERLVLEIFCF